LIHTTIWSEQAESDNPFATRRALCRGYDVYGEMVGKARWVEMLFLLLRDRLPGPAALDMLEALAVGLANPGPRDPSVHAAMCGGVGGSAAAASLIAALSVGAGRNGGAREVFDAMSMWHSCGRDLSAWALETGRAPGQPIEIWPEREHVPGFDPHGVSTATVVRQLLCTLARIGATAQVNWLLEHLDLAQQTIGRPLAMSGVAACVFVDLGLSPAEGEMLYLLLRLPGAAAHALEQTENGFRRFPFYRMELDEALCPEAA
jgi:citrate synthase